MPRPATSTITVSVICEPPCSPQLDVEPHDVAAVDAVGDQYRHPVSVDGPAMDEGDRRVQRHRQRQCGLHVCGADGQRLPCIGDLQAGYVVDEAQRVLEDWKTVVSGKSWLVMVVL